ncbi:WS/DGAT domain-containing protein [Blastococcus sp. URHD0036]|uniref:WS/DGAT domain-containing protein n=1 Tax=Blastococcus sp. URHD0036 TaxID=1380356 RepID=UPI0004962390|nr:WS/DGAT domain-containing protein [Blastococcus sp. URHD0036]
MTRHRMAAADSLWLELDRPENLAVVTSLMWTTAEVDPDRLRQVLRTRLVDHFPALRRRPETHDGLVHRGSWRDDPDFDLDRHLVVRPMPGAGDRAALQAFVGEERATPLDRTHPMWRMQLLQGYEGGSAVVTRFHHSVADGVRSTQLMLSLLEPLDGEPPELAARVGRPGPVPSGRGGARLISRLLNTAVGLAEIALWGNPRTALEGRTGIEKTVAWTDPVPLEVLRSITGGTGATVNDVCTTLVAGAMARYLDGHVAPPPPGDSGVAWMVPVNLEPAGRPPPADLGNHFALILLVLPHGAAAFPHRLAEVHRRMARIRDSHEPALTMAMARAMALLPTPLGAALMRFFAGKAVGVLTNVPGPRSAMALAGAPVAGVVGWAPTSGQQALTVTVFSYAGAVTFGFGTDTAVVPDPDTLVTLLGDELAEALAGA